MRVASYPAFRIAASAASATSAGASTRAVSVARLTLAPRTPGTFFSAFSTRATHEAHVIPSTRMSSVAGAAAKRGSAASLIAPAAGSG